MARNTVPNTVCSEHLFRTLSQNHPQDHQNHLQDHQKHTYKEPPKGGMLVGVVLMVLEVILVVLGLVLVVLGVALVVLGGSRLSFL